MNASETGPSSSGQAQGACRVQVAGFDGPLDLLLHLVRINEVDITNIPIAEIAAQFNAYLELMRELNLEIAGEYLVMAATLMHIKSRLLLPADPEESADGESADPRAEIVQQLLEYQRFKQAAESLQALETRRTLIWTRSGIPAGFEGEELLAVDMFDLLRAFRGVLGRLGEDVASRLRRDTVSVADKIAWLTELLEQRHSVGFSELLESLPTRLDRIAAFLAVLELVRLQTVVAFQRGIGGEIHLARPQAVAPEEP